jgi:hypothetical protein
LYLFQEALNAANHDIGKAQQSFFQAAMRVLPAPYVDGPRLARSLNRV